MTDALATPPRVLVFGKALLPASQTFVCNQMRALQRWQARLIGERYLADGLPLTGIDSQLLVRPGWLQQGAWRMGLALGRPWPPALQRLRNMRGDLIHAHFGTAGVDIGPYALALGLPLLVTLHGYDINTRKAEWQSGRHGWRRRAYPRQLLQLARQPGVGFACVSEAIRRRALDFGLPEDRLHVHYIGVDADQFVPGPVAVSKRAPTVLFVGRLVASKGLDVLLQAFARVREQCNGSRLQIIGDGPMRARWQAQASPLGDAVQFCGALSARQVRQQMQAARLLCLPSVTTASGESEGFGLVLLEAQACGLPVVSSARGGAREGMLDGQTGLRFAEGDVDTLARHLHSLLRDDARVESMSACARAFVVRHFRIEECTRQLETRYDALRASLLTHPR